MTGPKVVVGFLNGAKMVRDDFDQVLLHFRSFENSLTGRFTLQGTNISHQKSCLKMIFLFPRWDMLIPWRVFLLPIYHYSSYI